MLQVNKISGGDVDIDYVRNITFKVQCGECIAIVGRNGAGKTTLLKILAGISPVTRGSLVYREMEITRDSPVIRKQMGITLVPEGRRLFNRLSVLDNILMGAYLNGSDVRTLDQLLYMIRKAIPDFEKLLHRMPETLSGGEQTMVNFFRGWISRPQVLMLDEPALGLGPKFITVIKKLLREMLNDGGLIVLTEQSLILSPEFANTILVMDAGEIQQSIPKEKASPALLAQTIFSLEKSSVLNNSTESSSSRKE